MIINAHVPLHQLILSLSEALDHVHSNVAEHQHRVAYISVNIARQMGVNKNDLSKIFLAASLHDIGLIRLEDKVLALHHRKLKKVGRHAEAGYVLLRDNPLFARAAEIVRHHHVSWDHGRGATHGSRRVPMASHIVALADAVERSIDRDVHILDQAKTIRNRVKRLADEQFHPDCAEAFLDIAQPEAFWLDCDSGRIYSVLLEQMDWPSLTVDENAIEPIARIFAHVVDAASRWTATHTSGVAASAVALAKHFNFSPRELQLMRASGYFHDIGKLSVPSRILDKPGKLTDEEWSIMKQHPYHTFRILNTIGGMGQIGEWAAFHHERLDGSGYPFRHDANELTLGARIMSVADTFTALSEDRPYRGAIPRSKVVSILDEEVQGGALDGDVVAAIEDNYDEIDSIRRKEQRAYSRKQKHLVKIISSLQTTAD